MAFFEKDWFMRQLKLCVDMASSLILGKEFSPYQLSGQDPMTPADQLHVQVVTLLQEGDINGAEDALFEGVDPDDRGIYEVGLDFYDRLNQMTDKELSQLDFSREEIRDGLTDWSEEYGCDGLFDELKLSWSEE
jgi:hypothetical protein